MRFLRSGPARHSSVPFRHVAQRSAAGTGSGRAAAWHHRRKGDSHELFESHLISGISLGSVYAIIALGYTMVYGIAKMLNFAHGDVIMVGAYMCFCATSYLGLSPLMCVVFAVIVCTVLGIAIETTRV